MKSDLVAEGLGTGLLLYLIVGSGIVVQDLTSGGAVALLAHALVVGVGLAVLIVLFITTSGSHFNPAVTLAIWRSGKMTGRRAAAYVAVQVPAAVAGVIAAHLTFRLPVLTWATTNRDGWGRPLSELIGTFVLVEVILVLVSTGRTGTIAPSVGGWVAAIIFATSSTGFANPAVTVARLFSNTYTGIAPRWVPGFLVAQMAGALLAVLTADVLLKEEP
jgi:glycerol uptake facilitator-like aquaporin